MDLPLYVRVEKRETRLQLLRGELGGYLCPKCDFAGFAAIPLLWDDPERSLLTMLVDEDRETLLEEFEDLLQECRPYMGEERFREARRRSFQIVAHPTALVRIVAAGEEGRYCHRITPALGRADEFDVTSVIMAAKALTAVGRLADAYDMLLRLRAFPTSDVSFLRELAAYAIDVGEDGVARAALLDAKEFASRFTHVYEEIIPAEGVINRPPKGGHLEKLAEEADRRYSAMRPELQLPAPDRVRLGGEVLGALERSVAVADSPELNFYLRHTGERLERWLNEQQDPELVAAAEAQREDARQGAEAKRPPLELGPPPPPPKEGEDEPGDMAIIAGQFAVSFGNEGGAVQAFEVADEEGSAKGAFLHGLLLLKLERVEAAIPALERAAGRGNEEATAVLEKVRELIRGDGDSIPPPDSG